MLFLPEAVGDLRDLDGSARKVVAAGIQELRTDPELRGAPLGARSTANLTGLRKLVVGNRTYRIVYEVRDDGTVVVLWVIGVRADAEVYGIAKARVALYATDPAKKAILNQILDTAYNN
ncbi:MAG: type II toxin-antitoxin system RelE/ParE family toxin [Micropruina sp.]|nr:type II toxin-antitoxin system RelE/ParE family toxin [Micropruina sp.]